MNKSELIAKAARLLDEHDMRKPVHLDRRVYEIVDTTSTTREVMEGKIVIQPRDKNVRYTQDDVTNILEMIIYVVQDELAHGGSVSMKGLGTFDLVWRQPRSTKIPGTEQWVDIPGRFVPKFHANSGLRNAAQIYTMSMQNNPVGFQMPDPVYDQFEQPDEEYDDDYEDGDVDGGETDT